MRFVSGHNRSWDVANSNERLRNRLLGKRTVDSATGCWLYTGLVIKAGPAEGYAYMWLRGKRVRVHRVAAMLWLGFDLSSPEWILHRCDVRHCFNPAHLYVGTPLQNTRDAQARGRLPVGISVWNAVLTAGQVREMRALRARTGMDYAGIGVMFGVSKVVAWRAVTRRSYSSVM